MGNRGLYDAFKRGQNQPETFKRAKRLAAKHATMQDVISKGIEALERVEFAEAFQRDFAALRADRHAWDRGARALGVHAGGWAGGVTEGSPSRGEIWIADLDPASDLPLT